MKLEFSIFVKKHLISSMAGFQSPITIAQAIERIHRNEYLLPAFQRDFVWSAEQIEKLFDSLMKGYPISSMFDLEDKRRHKNRFPGFISFYQLSYSIIGYATIRFLRTISTIFMQYWTDNRD